MSDRWEKRARELWFAEVPGFAHELGVLAPSVKAALQLGREMQADRAEGITKALGQALKRCRPGVGTTYQGLVEAADIARSTIEKPKIVRADDAWYCERCGTSGSGQYHMCVRPFSELTVAPDGTLSGKLPCGHDVKAVIWSSAAGMEPFIGPVCPGCRKPKTREQVLEEALRELETELRDLAKRGRVPRARHLAECAANALEWKPS